ADESAVVKGAETVRFGPEAMGGVIVVNPKRIPTTSGSTGAVKLVGASEGRSGAASAAISGSSAKIKGLGDRRQSSGNYGGNGTPPKYFQSNTGIRELNFPGAAGYSPGRLGAELSIADSNQP